MESKPKLTCSERNKQKREKQKKLGLCIECNDKPIPGTVRCEHHTERHKLRDKKYKTLRTKQGLCSECGAVARLGYNRCEVHIANFSKSQKKYITRKRKEWKETNRCGRCGNELNPEMDGGCVNCLNCRIDAHLPLRKTDFKFV